MFLLLHNHLQSTETDSNIYLAELQLPRVFDRKRVERTGRVVAPIKETHLVGGGGDRENEALQTHTKTNKGAPDFRPHTNEMCEMHAANWALSETNI
jgi:hypothetical protein